MDFYNQDIQFVKTRANFIRNSYIEEMEKHILSFETCVNQHGVKVQWIVDENELVSSISSVFGSSHYNKVCFDIGEIPEGFKQNNNLIKQVSVEDFENNVEVADYLIIKADFAVVDSGSIVLVDKKSKNCFNKVKNLFIILDIDKLIVKLTDLETILYLQSINKNGKYVPDDIKILNAPMHHIVSNDFQSTADTTYSSQEVKVTLFLYDNGISRILENNSLRESLYCIDCGRCKTVCPVFAITKQYTPIDLVKKNCLESGSQEIFEHTTLCGNCNEVCPVQIPITDLLIEEMEVANEKRSRENSLDLLKILSKRSKLNKVNGRIRRYMFVKKYYGKNKKLLTYFMNQKENFYNIQREQDNK